MTPKAGMGSQSASVWADQQRSKEQTGENQTESPLKPFRSRRQAKKKDLIKKKKRA